MPEPPEFTLRTRQTLEEIEAATLSPFARRSKGSHASRCHEEPEHPYRTAFQRDRDRIIHSRAFRRLKHKRQVFLTSESDHYRTRITHTLEVAQLSRTMARVLGLNEDLVEAIALGHDLGHTPFGHLGEVILNKIMTGARLFEGQTQARNFGGFKHNFQSVRVVDVLEKNYPFTGLNLTAPVREGILKHTGLARGKVDYPDFLHDGLHFEQDIATTLESQVVAICDEIAQRTHDLEDGIRAGLVELQQVRELRIIQIIEQRAGVTDPIRQPEYVYLGLIIRGLINYLVDDAIKMTIANVAEFASRKQRLSEFDEDLVFFSDDLDPLQRELNKFIYKEIIHFSRVKWSDALAEKLLFRLFETYYQYPELLPETLLANELTLTKQELQQEENDPVNRFRNKRRFFRTVCDYVAGMTDSYAVRETERLARSHRIKIDDLRIESARGDQV